MTILRNTELTPAAVAWAQQFSTSKLNGKTVSNVSVYGRRVGDFTDNTTMHDVAEFLGTARAIYLPPSTGVAMQISSTSDMEESVGGTGVFEVNVVYLTAAGVQQSELIALTGTTTISIAGGALIRRIQWMHATRVGTNGVAVGTITIRKTSTLEIVEQITAGGNMSLSARYTIPLGYTGYLISWQASAGANAQDFMLRATVDKLARTILPNIDGPLLVFVFQDENLLAQGAQFDTRLSFMKCPPLCDVKVSTITATTNGNKVSASLELILVQN